MNILVSILLGYLIGSLPFTYLIGMYWGKVDLRKVGSGNLGATNAIRTLGIKIGIVAFLADLSKGVISFFLVNAIYGYTLALVAGAAAVVGHCYSIFLNFRGGKGVAGTTGLFLSANLLVTAIMLPIHLLTLLISRKMSLASITAAVSLPLIVYLVNGVTPLLYISLFLGAFVVYQHNQNIARLLKGTEANLF